MKETKFKAYHRVLKKLLKVDMLQFDEFGRVDSITVINEDGASPRIERYAKWDSDYPIIYIDLKEYTGKKDINGKELYYGDVVNLHVAGKVYMENKTINKVEDLVELCQYEYESGISFEIIKNKFSKIIENIN